MTNDHNSVSLVIILNVTVALVVVLVSIGVYEYYRSCDLAYLFGCRLTLVLRLLMLAYMALD